MRKQGFRPCAADAQFYFSGAPWEMVARNYTAQAINIAHDGSVTQSDVMVANAMVGGSAAATTGTRHRATELLTLHVAAGLQHCLVHWLVCHEACFAGRPHHSKLAAELAASQSWQLPQPIRDC